jgi:signal peptidase I
MGSPKVKDTRSTNNQADSGFSSSLWENFKQFFIAIILALIIKTSVVEAYKIPTASMEDTLLIGDFLLANKFIYGARLPIVDWRLPAIRDPKRGDVVIFIYPEDGKTKFIKRCVGLPGDTILVQNKQLYVNGEPFANPPHSKFIDNSTQPENQSGDRRFNFGPYIVPQKSYFMMGDNRDNSSDSRFWGTVPQELILGEAMLVHWSWDDAAYVSPSIKSNDPLSVPRVFLFNARHFFEKVRWGRLFGIIH